MLAQPFTKKTLIVSLILAAALVTVSFAVYSSPASSAPTLDRSYDGIEQIRMERSVNGLQADTSYDLVENLRAGRMLGGVVADRSYDGIEQLRAGRQPQADHSYDAIENIRLTRTVN